MHRICSSFDSQLLGSQDSKNAKNDMGLEERLEVNRLAEQHCSKLFTLKSCSDNLTENEVVYSLPPVNTMYKSSIIKVEKLQNLKDALNKVKGDAHRGEDMLSWTEHTFRVNPAASIFTHVKSKANPEFISQAFLKFYEVLCQFDVVGSEWSSMTSVHLCEAPGAFIVALNHYLKLHRPHLKWEWMGNTLNPQYEGCRSNECITDDRIIVHTLPHWVFGADGAGDITTRSCLEDLQRRSRDTGRPVLLVTADGSIDCQSRPGEQEMMTTSLHECEVITALHLLAPTGNCVVKMFTFFETNSLCTLYLLCCVFKEVHVFKPITSKLGNSEVYVVCLDYVGQDAIRPVLDVIVNILSREPSSFAMFDWADLPKNFVDLMYDCAKFFMDHQIVAIERNAHLYLNQSQLNLQACSLMQELVLNIFNERNPIGPINLSDRLILNDVRWDRNVHPSFGKHQKWTSCFQLEKDLKSRIDFADGQLRELIQQYSERESVNLYFLGKKDIVNYMNISRGTPVDIIYTTRFCYATLYNLYLTLSELYTSMDTTVGVSQTNVSDQCNVIYIKNGVVEDPQLLEASNQPTKDMVDSIMKDYPGSSFLAGEYPDHKKGPTSSCKLLETLFNLLSSNKLPSNSSIHLINVPLLSRLQNGLFVALSSCYTDTDLHQTLYHYQCTGAALPPVLKLRKLNTDRVHKCAEALTQAGWSEGAEKEGLLEIYDITTLIDSPSHSVACRYNINLLLIWTTNLIKLMRSS